MTEPGEHDEPRCNPAPADRQHEDLASRRADCAPPR